ncbi:MAG: MaoC family dehydratase [Rhodobacteraceae bacterium]|nr:MaoC family dehydratase [Paracoccaceae bacterium]
MPRSNIEVGTIYIEDMEIGLSRSISKTMGDAEIQMFAQVSEDYNPLHMDDDAANASVFKGRIAHGMLTSSLLSAIIGEQLPGHGAIYLSQSMKFLAPVRPGDHVTATVTVAEIFPEKNRVLLDCTCTVGDKMVLKGEALVLALSRND